MSNGQAIDDFLQIIRKRAGMYIGSFNTVHGLLNFIKTPLNWLIWLGATEIETIVDGVEWQIRADVRIKHHLDGEILLPFESRTLLQHEGDKNFASSILAALSKQLTIYTLNNKGQHSEISYRQGVRTNYKTSSSQVPSVDNELETSIAIKIDDSILTVQRIDPAVFNSFIRRKSYFNPQVRFRINYDGVESEYHSKNGLKDLFDEFSAPYQILNEPIQIDVSQTGLTLELIFAFHSWENNVFESFIQVEGFSEEIRPAEGGLHQTGILTAIRRFFSSSDVPKIKNGIVGVTLIKCSDIEFESNNTRRVADAALRKKLEALVLEQLQLKFSTTPKLYKQFKQLDVF